MGPLKSWVGEQQGVDVIFAQETHLTGEAVEDLQRWAATRGWYAVGAPAVPGVGKGTIGGVVMMVRGGSIGITDVVVVSNARVVCATANFSGGPNVTLASVYLVTGEGVRQTNIDILVDLGTELRKRAQPFIVAGDFQMEPAAMHDTSFPQKIRANIVAPEGAMGTCVTKEGYSTIDYFLVSEGLAPSVERVCADVRRYANPHRPVHMRLRKDFPDRKIRVWTHRARLAIEAPIGPRRKVRCWEGPLAAANKALDIACRAGRAKETQAAVTAAYSLIAAAAASEIAWVGDQCIEQKFLKRFGMVPNCSLKAP